VVQWAHFKKYMKFDSHLFKTSSTNLEYIEAGSGDTVLFLHGLGYKGTTYNEVIEQISHSHHVYAPNLHFSVHAQAISSLEEYIDVLQKFIRAKKLKRITIIGHSFGGGIALKLAESNSNISRLILTGTAGLPMSYSIAQFSFLLIVKTWHELKYKKPFSILVRLVWDFSLFTIKLLPHFSKMTQAVTNMTNEEHIQFQNIHIPALLLWGKNDEIFPQSYAERLNHKLTNSKLIIVNGNHDLILFEYQKFNNLFTEYCKQKTGSRN